MSDDQKYSDEVMRLLDKLPQLYFHSMPVIGEVLTPDDPLALDDTLVYNAKSQLDLYDIGEIKDNVGMVFYLCHIYNEQKFEFSFLEFEFSYMLTVTISTTKELHFLLAVSNSIPGLFLAMTRIFGFIQAGILPGTKMDNDNDNDNNNNNNNNDDNDNDDGE